MIGLDTSVVLRLLVGEPAAQAERARRRLEALPPPTPARLSDLVVGESYVALRHHYGVPDGEAVRALRDLVLDPRIAATGAAEEVLENRMLEPGPPGLMDRLIHADYRRSGVDLVTFDPHAARLPGAELLVS